MGNYKLLNSAELTAFLFCVTNKNVELFWEASMLRYSPKEMLSILKAAGVVPTIGVQDTVSDYLRIAQELSQAGLPVMEILFRPTTKEVEDRIWQAVKAIKYWRKNEFIVGCGTIQDRTAAEEALEAGAQFLVSNLIPPEAIDEAHKNGVLMIPSAGTHTEVDLARTFGCGVIKLFLPKPVLDDDDDDEKWRKRSIKTNCWALGQYQSCFPDLEFVVTGGVTLWNVAAYLRKGFAFVCAGSSLVKPALVKTGDWAQIAKDIESFVAAVREARKG